MHNVLDSCEVTLVKGNVQRGWHLVLYSWNWSLSLLSATAYMQLSHGPFANCWLFDYKLPSATRSQIIVQSAGALFSIGRPSSARIAEKTRPLTGSLLTSSTHTAGLDPYESLVSLGVRSHSIFRLLELSTGNKITHFAFLLPYLTSWFSSSFSKGTMLWQCRTTHAFAWIKMFSPLCKLDRLSDLFLVLKKKIPKLLILTIYHVYFSHIAHMEARSGSDIVPAT